MLINVKRLNQGTYVDFAEVAKANLDKLNLKNNSNCRYLLLVNDDDGKIRRIGDEYVGNSPIIMGQVQDGNYYGTKVPRLREPHAYVLNPQEFKKYIRQNINGYFGRMHSSERLHPLLVFGRGLDGKISWDRLHILDGSIEGLISNGTYFQTQKTKQFKSKNWSFSLLELIVKEW